ncbi:MAG TPA: aminomethyl-transferring glycine dehydrogenase subunit GcvPB [Methanomassiliicoccales archaeon]|nr:aminomethyl-transferring glycine dehydrogenase subunit GcvPB [Methanomassiliicoccales archaeon]
MYHQARYDRRVIMEKDGRTSFELPFAQEASSLEDFAPKELVRKELDLPSLPEREVVKHYVNLSQMNYSIDNGMYPLGSCTMKYNPKYADVLASLPSVQDIHPYQDEETVQGALKILFELERALCEISGMDAVTLHPAAGAHGEFTGMLLAKAYHAKSKEERTEVIVPDSAHGTNPASAAMAGFQVIEIPSGSDGCVDLEALKAAVSEKTAAFMITNPNTLGIFESQIREIAQIVHDAGALLYYDGANLNAVMGWTSPGAMDFDIVHFNLHKTFATPHGGGGPGAGPVGVRERLIPFLPVPRIVERNGHYRLDYDRPDSIGKVRASHGNFAVLVRAYAYILKHGSGLKEVSERAVLNSNYLKHKLQGAYALPFKELRKHEFVVSAKELKEKKGIRALDVGKRLLDYGFHAPTIYFPSLVDEALMIEPTETETKETLDAFADVMNKIALEEDPEVVKSAPHNAAVKRVDEVYAAKEAILSWRAYKKKMRQT